MKLRTSDHLSVLACATGLVIVAVALAFALAGHAIPQALPMLATAIVGFELYFVLSGYLGKRIGGGTNA